MPFFLVTTQKLGLKITENCIARVNLTHWLWLLVSNSQVQGSIPDPLASDSLRYKEKEREREREACLCLALVGSRCRLFAVSVFFCGVVAACFASFKLARMPRFPITTTSACADPSFPQVRFS